MSTPIENLLSILDLEEIEHNIYRGRSPQVGWQRVFGGLVISQALVAASRTVEGKTPHSLHGYFILAGDPNVPIVYQVDRIRDGKSFATRNCVAIQHGRAIFSLSASYQMEEPGLDHAISMPQVKAPEELPSEADLKASFTQDTPEPIRRFFDQPRPIESRHVDPNRYKPRSGVPGEPVQYVWFRASGALPNDPAVHRAVLAYLSDMTLLDTALIAHGKSAFQSDMQVASLDHALWFHRPFRADDWLLYAQDSPSSSGARGLTRGSIFTRDGRLIASVAQEGLLRQR